jgi:hypothetical protein
MEGKRNEWHRASISARLRQYFGEFIDGEQFGYGELPLDDDTIYKGDWRKGKMHGLGSIVYADGKIRKGVWKNGKH